MTLPRSENQSISFRVQKKSVIFFLTGQVVINLIMVIYYNKKHYYGNFVSSYLFRIISF